MSQTPPNRGTRALNGASKTSGFGDSFVASNEGAPQQQRSTRTLKMSPAMIKDALPSRIAETKRDLDYVRHLVDLFRPFVNVLRMADLILSPPPPLPDSEEEESEGPSPMQALWEEQIAALRLSAEKQELATAVSERVRTNHKLQQRMQIALHQYLEAENGYTQALKSFALAANSAPENSWQILDNMAVERLKGKAYAICGFYDNFKDDPVLGRIFPPPNLSQQQQKPRVNLGGEKQPPATRPLPKETTPPPKKPGFLDGLKGIFGK
ncbi:MAG TPA: hypothetical protein DD435_16650 [Cyanobacteria bacterium UBA8530]|nr:hypothetical protein [Cyanobacteria bacterium UBA8530]